MLRNMKLGNRIALGVCLTVAIVFSFYSFIVFSRTQTISVEGAEKLAVQMAGRYGNEVKNNIEKALDASKATAAAFVAMSMHPDTVDRDAVDEIQKQVTLSDPTFFGIQSVFAPNALDGRDDQYRNYNKSHGETGRYGAYWYRSGSSLEVEDLIQYDPDNTRAWYMQPRDKRAPVLTEPYYTEVAKVNMATVSVPMFKNGKFMGIVGIDFVLSAFQDMVEDIKPMETGYAALLSNKGVIVAHPEKDVLLKNITDNFPAEYKNDILKAIENGDRLNLHTVSNLDGVEYEVLFEPITIAGTDTPWAMAVAIPTAKINEVADEFLVLSLGISAVAVALIFLVVFLLVRSATKPIDLLVTATKEVSEGRFDAMPDESKFGGELLVLHSSLVSMVGDLENLIRTSEEKTQEAEEKTEMASKALEEAEEARAQAEIAKRDGMLQAADHLEDIVHQVTSASEELASQIEESSRGSEVQRERTSETATAMEEMNASVLEVAQNASQAADSANNALTNAQEGAEIVEQVVVSINRVQTESEKMNEGLSQLGSQAEDIGHIMNVITDIADQTNLLALNAAIEAARAGDAGRGFAVVADEVRKLAEKTMNATKEVGAAVSAIQEGTRRNIDGMNQSVSLVNESTELASRAGDSLRTIQQIVESTADQVRAIATASEQQSAASEEINRGTDEINRIAAETAEAMNQSSIAITDLAQLAERLQAVINDLKSV